MVVNRENFGGASRHLWVTVWDTRSCKSPVGAARRVRLRAGPVVDLGMCAAPLGPLRQRAGVAERPSCTFRLWLVHERWLSAVYAVARCANALRHGRGPAQSSHHATRTFLGGTPYAGTSERPVKTASAAAHSSIAATRISTLQAPAPLIAHTVVLRAGYVKLNDRGCERRVIQIRIPKRGLAMVTRTDPRVCRPVWNAQCAQCLT